MKKILFFAFALVAGALAFTSCNGNDPKNPGEYDPKDYVGTQWVTDSTRTPDGLSPAPHAYIKVKSESLVEINGNDTQYKIEGAKMTIHVGDENPMTLDIQSADKDHAILLMPWGDEQGNPVTAIVYMTRIDEPKGSQLPVTEANVLGKWRLAYFVRTETYYEEGSTEPQQDIIKHGMAGVETHEFKTNGEYTVSNSFDFMWDAEPLQGWWEIKNGLIVYATYDKPAEIPAEWYMTATVYENVMTTHQVHSMYNGGTMEYLYYFIRLQ